MERLIHFRCSAFIPEGLETPKTPYWRVDLRQ